MRALLHMNCDKFDRFSIENTFSSPLLSKCVLTLFAIRLYVHDGLITLSIISVIFGSKINSVMIGNKLLVASLVIMY